MRDGNTLLNGKYSKNIQPSRPYIDINPKYSIKWIAARIEEKYSTVGSRNSRTSL